MVKEGLGFSKYHALGNDYIVIRPEARIEGQGTVASRMKIPRNSTSALHITPEMARTICDRHYGVGSDGILLGPLLSESCDFGLRIINPDGSEAEKSGNGLRIFARSLVDDGISNNLSFTVETPGGAVECKVSPDRSRVTVAMGQVSFNSEAIPVTGLPREVLLEKMEKDGREITFCAATVGNPHCVVLTPRPSAEEAYLLGPLIEVDPRFPRRTNVQFLQVLDRANIRIEIWERGAGYTLASGSSSTAAAAVAHRLGLCDREITVHMPGGQIDILLDEDFYATMSGDVTKVCDGRMAREMFVD